MSQTPPPDSSSKSLPPWLLFALLVVGPPAALLPLTRTLTVSPVLLVLFLVGYEALLFMLGFAGKIWQRLEDPLVERFAQWITFRVQLATSRYYRRYCQYLIYEHQVFDVKGLTTSTAYALELEQVFVDLEVDPMPRHSASAEPLHLPESLLQGTHSIWDYLASTDLANPHLAILGAPGSGKTTLLKQVALTLAQSKRFPRRQEMRHTFPILLVLRDHAHAIVEQPTFSLTDAVEAHVQQKWQQHIPAAWIRSYLERGKCLILLDGLDEVADRQTRKLVAGWVERQLLTYGRNRFVLTSRPFGYRENPLEGVTVLEVQPFAADQVERFIRNWYLANERKSWGKDDPGIRLRAREGATDLLQRLHRSPALLALAVNPLLLTMIVTVHHYRGSLPGRRVDLYAEICEVFLGKRHEARGITQDLSPAQKQRVLQFLAYSLMQQGMREIESKAAQQTIAPALALVSTHLQPVDFLPLIENTSGLLVERNPGIYGFSHLTFQEFLAAEHIKAERLATQALVPHVADSWWHETIRLYCAQADATALIRACLASNPPTVPMLALALECAEEALRIQPQVLDQLNAVLEGGIEDPDPERRRIVAETRLTHRLRRMVPLHEETYLDTSLISCAEYQVFLDEQRSQGNYYQPDHWSDFSFPKGSGSAPVLGVRRSDALAFCKWLTARDAEGWRYRLPRAEEWPLEERRKQEGLSAETGYWVDDTPYFVWSQGTPPDHLQQRLPGPLTHAIDSASSRPILALDLDRIYDLALDLDRTLTRARAKDLARAHDLTSDLARIYARTGDLPPLDVRASMVMHARDLVGELVHAHDLAPIENLYVMLFFLSQRMKGAFPAYEGMLLCKERY